MSDSKRKPKEQKAANIVSAPAPADVAAKVSQKIQDVAQKATERAADGVAQVQAAAGQTVQALRDEVGSVRDEARQSFSQGRQKALDWERGIEDKIRSRPLVSLLYAGAVGFLLALFFLGNRDRD